MCFEFDQQSNKRDPNQSNGNGYENPKLIYGFYVILYRHCLEVTINKEGGWMVV